MTEPFLAAAYKNDMKANGGEKDAYAYFPVAIGQNQDLHITVAFLPNPTETQLNALDVLFETMALVARTERPIATVTRQAFFYDGTDREPEDEETVVPDGAVPVLVVKMAPLYTFLINQYAKDHLVNKFGNEYPILHILSLAAPELWNS